MNYAWRMNDENMESVPSEKAQQNKIDVRKSKKGKQEITRVNRHMYMIAHMKVHDSLYITLYRIVKLLYIPITQR